MNELKKRLFTSLLLIGLLLLVYINNTILIITTVIFCIIMSKEFYFLINKIKFTKKKINILGLIIWFILSLYITFFGYITILNIQILDTIFLFSLAICIATDIGGYVFGKIFKGRKLTKISPNKTISGVIGSFLFTFLVAFIFYLKFILLFANNTSITIFFISCLFTCTLSQIGDLFISYLKRKANVKNTGNLLPGHGGILDRLDGIIFTVPLSTLLISVTIN
jgi:phosphatidate cytidylyltransferase